MALILKFCICTWIRKYVQIKTKVQVKEDIKNYAWQKNNLFYQQFLQYFLSQGLPFTVMKLLRDLFTDLTHLQLCVCFVCVCVHISISIRPCMAKK